MRALPLLAAITFVGSLQAQIDYPDEGCMIRYQYDDAGNRIQRDWYCWGDVVKSRAANGDSTAMAQRLLSEVHMNAFPNPASDALTVTFTDEVPSGTLEVLDAGGRSVRSLRARGTTAVLDVSGIAPGNYWLAFITGQERIVVGLIIANESGTP